RIAIHHDTDAGEGRVSEVPGHDCCSAPEKRKRRRGHPPHAKRNEAFLAAPIASDDNIDRVRTGAGWTPGGVACAWHFTADRFARSAALLPAGCGPTGLKAIGKWSGFEFRRNKSPLRDYTWPREPCHSA